ncbi:hypothetical protein FRC12_010304 [Ceratobasidium sp. 428]|nr:hypothetical protein FRC12_010304 [Ceratobasidium sp. 428]
MNNTEPKPQAEMVAAVPEDKGGTCINDASGMGGEELQKGIGGGVRDISKL